MEFLKGFNEDNNVYPFWDLKTPVMGMEYLDEIGNMPAFPSKPLGNFDDSLINGDIPAIPMQEEAIKPEMPIAKNIKDNTPNCPKTPTIPSYPGIPNEDFMPKRPSMPYMNTPMPYMNTPIPHMNMPMPYMNTPIPHMNKPMMPYINNIDSMDNMDMHNMNCQEVLKCLKIMNCLQNMNDMDLMRMPKNC